MITTDRLISLGFSADVAETWAEYLAGAADEFDISTGPRVAFWLAQMSHESRFLQSLSENLNYSADGLANTWPNRFADLDQRGRPIRGANGKNSPNILARKLHRNPEAIANHVYADRFGNGDIDSGDGWRYRGQGPFQITFLDNHQEIARRLGLSWDEYLPEHLQHPSHGARSAAAFWQWKGLNRFADADDPWSTSKIINGGTNGLQERLALTQSAMEIFA